MAVESERFARIELQGVHYEDAPILLNLLELYSHDFSEYCRVDIGQDGRFGYKSLPQYWSEPGRHSFLIRTDGQLAGLALVKRGSEFSGTTTVWDLAEFFVLRVAEGMESERVQPMKFGNNSRGLGRFG